ncbi:MAG TPA: gamma carbonic anhydrase family protein [bacterium]|nr:gamma carbonic anhydrase family protein [bacterium]
MAKYEFGDKKPEAGPGTWVHETAQLIGDVMIGKGCYIAAGAVLRGDFGSIRVGDRTSIQENCALHCRPGESCVVGSDVTVGHGAVLHGCRVEDRALIGIQATVSDGAVIGRDSIVAETSFVKAGTVIPERSLVSGNPAVIKGVLKDHQVMIKDAGAAAYAQLTEQYFKHARRID